MAAVNPFPPKVMGKPPGKPKGSYILEGLPSHTYCVELFRCVKSVIQSMNFKWWDNLADDKCPLPRYHITIAAGKSSLEAEADKKVHKENLKKENTEYAKELQLFLDRTFNTVCLWPTSIEISKNGWVILNFTPLGNDNLKELHNETVRIGQSQKVKFKEDEIGANFKLHMSIGHVFYLMPDVRKIPGYTVLKDQKLKNKKRDEARTQCIAQTSERAKKDLSDKQAKIMDEFQGMKQMLNLNWVAFSYNPRDESLSISKSLAMKDFSANIPSKKSNMLFIAKGNKENPKDQNDQKSEKIKPNAAKK